MSTMTCSTGAAYPQVCGVRPDAEAVRLLLLDYASASSEMTALSEYMYQHNVLLAEMPEVADTLECIGIVEMNHAVELQKAIRALGGDARYFWFEGSSVTPDYWGAESVGYGKYVRDILMRDIAAEEAAIAQYEAHAEVIPIAQVKALLLRIAEDERLHVRMLTALLNDL